MPLRFCCVVVALMAIAVRTEFASATNYSWINAAGGTFSVAGNWTPAGPPTTAADSADFNLNAIYTVTITSPANMGSLNFSAGLVTIQNLSGGTALNVAGQVRLTSSATIAFGTFSCGSLTIENSARYQANNPGGPITGLITLNGGTYSGNCSLGAFLPGTFMMNGGTAAINGLFLGGNFPATFTQSAGVATLQSLTISNFGTQVGGSYFLNGGSVVNNATRIGGVSNGTFTQTAGTHQTATFAMGAGGRYMQSGGLLNVLDTFVIDPGATFTLSAGLVQFNNSSGFAVIRGNFTQTGAGTLSTANSATLQFDGASAVGNFSTTPAFNSNRTLRISNGGSFSGGTPLNMGVGTTGGSVLVSDAGSRLSINGDSQWAGFSTVTFSNSGVGTINGAVTVGNGTLNLGIVNLNSGAALNVNSMVVAPGSAININGGALLSNGTVSLAGSLSFPSGTLRASHLELVGGSVSWTAGTFHLTAGGASLGGGGALPASLLLDSSRTLSIGGTTTINLGARLTLDNSVFSTGGLVNNGTLTLISGTLNITGAAGLNVGAGVGVGSILTIARGVTANITGPMNVLAGSVADIVGTSISMGSGNNSGKINFVDSTVNLGSGVIGSGTTNIVDCNVTGLFNGQTGSRLNIGGQTRLAATAIAHRTALLSIAPDGQLDLTAGAMVIDYPAASPFASVRNQLASGFAGGAWNGEGIVSSNAAAQSNRAVGIAEASQLGNPATFLGQPLDTTAVLIRCTLYGDSDLNGTVNISDFAQLAANFNVSTNSWFRGDYNYDGITTISDFALLASNFNLSLPNDLPRESVPEPNAIVMGALAVTIMSRSRKA